MAHRRSGHRPVRLLVSGIEPDFVFCGGGWNGGLLRFGLLVQSRIFHIKYVLASLAANFEDAVLDPFIRYGAIGIAFWTAKNHEQPYPFS